ncbi:MAG: LacI family DNA-binding transcriptional regulator [Pseudomonadota bacterium]
MQDVARAARVSTATVSRVLSNSGPVAERTREAVMEAVRGTGYRANQAARNLRMRRAGAILILVPNLGKPFYSGILAGLSEGFADSGYELLIADTESGAVRDDALATYFADGRIDGAVCLDGDVSPETLRMADAQDVSGRIVFLCEWPDGRDFPIIASDNAAGARAAVRHLHELGHRRIAHVTGPEGNVLTAARREGMLAERAALDLPTRPDWIIRGDFSLESGRRAANALLAMDERPTAVFCSADMVAFGLIAGLSEGGLDVPTDISVVGFDDIEMSQYYVPALTTIRQDRQRMGRRAATALLERLADPSRPPTPEPLIPIELVVRASTAAPR